MSTEDILSQLAILATRRFNLSIRETVAVVARSKIGNEIYMAGNPGHLSLDELSRRLFDEITMAR
jgi:hypothetical protein